MFPLCVQAGLLTYMFAYEVSAHGDDYNHWALKITTTRPDGSQLIAYNNFIGQTMLTDLASGSDHWINFHQFDGQALETLHAMPSAVVGYDDTQADLGVVLKANAGLIHLTEYYATTTATPTTPGGAAGYVQFRKLSEGASGTPIAQSETTYIQRPAGVVTIYPVAEMTVFRDDAGTEPIATSFDYTWFSGTAQIEQRTTTLPVVPTGQNGAGGIDTVTEIFDEEGNLVWRRDARGYITQSVFDRRQQGAIHPAVSR